MIGLPPPPGCAHVPLLQIYVLPQQSELVEQDSPNAEQHVPVVQIPLQQSAPPLQDWCWGTQVAHCLLELQTNPEQQSRSKLHEKPFGPQHVAEVYAS